MFLRSALHIPYFFNIPRSTLRIPLWLKPACAQAEKQLAALQRQLRDLQLDQQIAQKRHDDLVHVKQAAHEEVAAARKAPPLLSRARGGVRVSAWERVS